MRHNCSVSFKIMKIFILFLFSTTIALNIVSNEINHNVKQFWAIYKQVFSDMKQIKIVAHSHLVPKFPFFFQNPYKNLDTLQFVTKCKTKSSAILLFVPSIEELYSMIFDEDVLWNSDTHYLFVSLICSHLINKTLSELWSSRKIYKAVLICDIDTFNMFMYVPLLFGSEEIKKIKKNEDITYFIQNGVHNLQGTKFRALLYPNNSTAIQIKGKYVAGTDWKALQLLSKYMNFTPIFLTPSDGTEFGHYKNGGFTGPFKDLVDGKVDICMIGHFLRKYKKQQFISTYQVGRDYVSIVLPQATNLPHYNVIVQIFQNKIWCCLLFIYILATVVNILIFKFSRSNLQNLTSISVAFSIYQMIITGIVNVKSKKLSYRIFLAFIFVTILIISNTFQGSLITFISMPLHYPNIDTVEDLIVSPLPIVISQNVWDEIYFEDPDMIDLTKKIQIETDLSKYAEGNLALFVRVPYSHRFLYKNYVSYLYPESVKPFHIMEEYLIAYYITYVLPENSPHMKRVNYLLMLFQEHGLIQKWDSDTLFFIKSVFLPQNYDQLNQKTTKPFTLEDLDFAFYLLYVGLTFSTFTFICECIFFMKYK